MLSDIDHVQLAMPKGEEDAARSFYGDVLGLKEIEKPEILRARPKSFGRAVEPGSSLEPGKSISAWKRTSLPRPRRTPAFLVRDLDLLRDKLVSAGFPVIEDKLTSRL